MTTQELLGQFANPETIMTLSASDKMTAGLVTTLLGMGITFTALILLLVLISWMEKMFRPAQVKIPERGASPHRDPAPPPEVSAQAELTKDEELVAAITTAVAMALNTSVSNLVVRNIERVGAPPPAWNRAGIQEQMDSRY